jgi:nicotinamide mononucleotide adenylyltransferase
LIAVVVSELPGHLPSASEPLGEIAAEHHERERNPWPSWERCDAIREAWGGEVDSGRIRVAAIPRPQGPQAWWNFVTAFLPPERHWILKWNDDFERAKKKFFESIGERCTDPVPQDPSVPRGDVIRSRLTSGESIAELVPPSISAALASRSDGADL